jgi:hypothetical protein
MKPENKNLNIHQITDGKQIIVEGCVGKGKAGKSCQIEIDEIEIGEIETIGEIEQVG